MVFVCKKIYSDMIDPKQFIDSSLDERWYPQKIIIKDILVKLLLFMKINKS